MKYKRLTDKRLAIPKNAFRQSKSKEEYIELSRVAYKTDNTEIYNRLAELEDKIEQGTLIELPCKVGDKFYQVVKGLPIYEWEVETIVFSNIYFPLNYVITARRSKDLAFWKFWSEDFGKTVFLTREEAEKRLKELQE